jgi:hypothetical protein
LPIALAHATRTRAGEHDSRKGNETASPPAGANF